MKSRRIKINKKGITGIEIAVIGAIVIVTIIISLLIPIAFLKIHLVTVVETQYGYNNADLTLLTLLSDRDVYEKLSLYVAGMEDNTIEGFNRAAVESEVALILDKLVPSDPGTRCYKLSYVGGVIIPPENCDTEFGVSANIVLPYGLPYGKNKEKITLEIK